MVLITKQEYQGEKYKLQTFYHKGYGYETSDGIYYDISKFPQYGMLSKSKADDRQAGARVEVNDEKRNPQKSVAQY